MTPPLTAAQRAALAHVRSRARALDLAVATRQAALPPGLPPPAEWVARLRAHRRLTVHFHPDRVVARGRTMAEALEADGVYRSQFETGVSSGGLTAFPGGERDQWEAGLFGGAYQGPGVGVADRPKYAGWDLLGHSDGACPRFGSCHLRLRPAVLERATFNFGDSVTGPTDVGTVDAFAAVLTAAQEHIVRHGALFGRAPLTLAGWFAELATDAPGASWRGAGRSLDAYVEAQVHGPLRLHEDVEAVVVDPCFRGEPSGAVLQAAAARYGFAVEWGPSWGLPATDVPPEFRGPQAVALAAHLATTGEDDWIDAAVLGRAAASVVREPGAWADWGEAADTLQQLKYLWHVLVRYGRAPDGTPGRWPPGSATPGGSGASG